MSLPTALYTVAQVRAFDDYAIKIQGVPGYLLMQRAGAAALAVLRQRWPNAKRLAIVCGGGNNGGDGYVVARLAEEAGLAVSALAVAPASVLGGDARRACEDYLARGRNIYPFDAGLLAAADVVVDALFGTGVRAPLSARHVEAIDAINGAARPVLALDLPSGLNGDTGAVVNAAVRADCTVTFVAPKQGLVLGVGPEYCGELYCDDLGVQIPPGRASAPVLMRLVDELIASALPLRSRDCHKGDFGRVLIIGGGPGMPGAALLAGEACLRVGAGLVTIATAPEHAVAVAAARPELICLGIAEAGSLRAAMQSATVIAVGPGLGRSAWAVDLLDAALQSGRPLVLDADALNLLAERDWILPAAAIITPHPGEAARLLECSSAEVQQDRILALNRLVARARAVVVLKGAGTLIGAPEQTPALCTAGNPGMATAGMGDVLTGAIAGILAQCHDPWLAARVGVLLHAQAGDEEAQHLGARGLLALDVAVRLTRRANRR